MNAKQEILDALEGLEELNLTCETSAVYDNNHRTKHREVDRIRATLDTHELAPVDKRAKIKAGKVVLELWRDLSGRAQMPDLRYDCDKEVRAEIFCAWRDRLLGVARKQDTRPFDPALCGFAESRISEWYLPKQTQFTGVLISRNPTDRISIHCSGDWRNHSAGVYHGQWPTQSDGETLLRLLGVLV